MEKHEIVVAGPNGLSDPSDLPREVYLKSWASLRRKVRLIRAIPLAAVLFVMVPALVARQLIPLDDWIFACAIVLTFGSVLASAWTYDRSAEHLCPWCGKRFFPPYKELSSERKKRQSTGPDGKLCANCNLPRDYLPPEKPQRVVYR